MTAALPRFAAIALLLIAHGASAQTATPARAPAATPELPDSYAVAGRTLSFFNTPNRRHFLLTGGDPAELANVAVALARPSDLLVQFSSGIATVVPDGCPCSVRVSLKVDDQEPVVIKRVNLGAVSATVKGVYQPDRQSADGSYVFTLPAGRHRIALLAQRVDGDSATLHIFYRNLQALSVLR